jgi:hypothetical protein
MPGLRFSLLQEGLLVTRLLPQSSSKLPPLEPPPPPPRDPIKDAQDKDDIKRRTKIAEENRKKRTALLADRAQWEELERIIDDGISQATEYSKSWAGTGRGAQARSFLGGVDSKTQDLDTTLNKLSLDQMVKQFSGMSQMMNTKAEQSKFQKSVPSIGMDDGVLMKELRLRKEAAQRAKQRIDEALSKFDEEGNPVAGGSSGTAPAAPRRKTVNGQVWEETAPGSGKFKKVQ